MKTILIGATMLLSNLYSLSQVVQSTNPILVKEHSFPNNSKQFHDSHYFVECETIENRVNYFIYDLTNSTYTTLESPKVFKGLATSVLLAYYVVDGYLYEMVLGGKIGKSEFVITKRSLNDETQSQVLWSYERKSPQMGTDRMSFYMDANGAIIVSAGEDMSQCFIERFDVNMKSLWKKTMEGLLLPQVEFTFQKLESGTVIIHANSSPVEDQKLAKGGMTVNKTQMRLIAVEPNDEMYCITPQVDKPMAVSNSVYTYNSDKNEFYGLLLTHNIPSSGRVELSGQGIAYYRWSNDGTILLANTKNLTYGDIIKSEDKKVLTKLGLAANFSNEDPLPAFAHPLMRSFSKENGEFVVYLQRLKAISGSPSEPFGEGGFILRINEDGELAWSTFIPASPDLINIASSQLVIANGKLHLVHTDYEKNAGYESGILGVKSSKNEQLEASILHFDLESGALLGADALNLSSNSGDYFLSFLLGGYTDKLTSDVTNTEKCVYVRRNERKSKEQVFYNICFE